MENRQSSIYQGIDLDVLEGELRDLILVVDDEEDTTTLLKTILKDSGFNVSSALNGEEALEKNKSYHPHMILLDLMMPEMDGIETLQKLRALTSVPVIILSALSDKHKIVEGLRLGADDYVTKPFHYEELVERVRAVLRRVGTQSNANRFEYPDNGLVIDVLNHTVNLHGQNIDVTPKEFEILTLLAKHSPNMVDYAVICSTLWGEDDQDARNRLKYLVYLLRNKLKKAAPSLDLIKNINRLGYKLNV